MVEVSAEELTAIDQTIMDLLDALDPTSLDSMDQNLKDEIANCQQIIAGKMNSTAATAADQGSMSGPGG